MKSTKATLLEAINGLLTRIGILTVLYCTYEALIYLADTFETATTPVIF